MEQGLDFNLSPCPVSHASRCSAQSLPPIAMAPGSCGATSRSARGRIQIFSNLGSRDSRENEREGMEGMEGMEEPPHTHTHHFQPAGVLGPGARGSTLSTLTPGAGACLSLPEAGRSPPPAPPLFPLPFRGAGSRASSTAGTEAGLRAAGRRGPRQRGRRGRWREQVAAGAMRRGALLAGALAAYAVYLVLGALLVARLEQPHEARLRAELETLREELLRRSPCVAAPALDAFVERVLAAGRLGRAALANASGPANASDPAWDFASALFFASTLVTTVGT